MNADPTRRQVLASVGAVATAATTAGASAGRAGATGSVAAVQSGGRWPAFGFDRANTGHSPDATGPPADAGPAVTFATDDPIRAAPAIVDGTVYLGSTDRTVYALDADSAEVRWEVETGGEIHSAPAVADGTVYVGSDDGTLYAFDAGDGSVEWTFETGDAVRSPPTVADGRVYVGSWDASVYAVDAAAGTEAWSFETGDRVDTAPAFLTGTGDGDDGPGPLVCVGSWDGSVHALDAAEGTEEWRFETALGEPIRGAPAAADGRVYVGGGIDGSLYALDAGTGDELWREDIGGSVVTSPAVAGGRVYAATRDGASSRIHALETDGTPAWTFENGLELAAPAVAGGRVYAASRDGTVHALTADGGEVAWSFEAETGIQSAPAVAGARLYVGSDGGRLYALAEGGTAPVGGGETDPDQVTGPPGGGGGGFDGPGPAFLVGPALLVAFVAIVAGGLYTAHRAGLLARLEGALDSVDPLFVDESADADDESGDPGASTPVWELVVADVVGRAEQTDRTATRNLLVTKYVDSDTLDSPVVAYEVESYRDDPARVRLVEERFERGDRDGSAPLGDGWRVADDRLVFEATVDPDETLRTLVGRQDCPPDRLDDLLEQPEITVEETRDDDS